MESKTRPQRSEVFETNWTQWIMETAYRWEDLSDVIKLTGIDIVDDDHKVLTEYAIEFNRLFDFTETGGFDLDFINALEKLFAQLFSFTREHFSREQEIIKNFGIPGLKGQINQHERILGMLQEYMDEIQTGKLNIALKFKSTFMDWLADHINRIDYNTFRLDKIGPIVLSKAKSWDDAKDLVRSVGFLQIDEDHRQLVEYALEFNKLIEENDQITSVEQKDHTLTILNKILSYVKEHFAREETLIERHQLKGLDLQREEHQKISIKFKSYINDLEQDRAVSLQQLKTDILQWWVYHINEIDYDSFKADNWIINILSEAREWNDVADLVIRTDVESVDNQHRIQTEFILEMTESLEKFASKKPLQEEFDWIVAQSEKIYQFAEKHFEHEERLLQAFNPPNMAIHVTEHMALLDKIQEYIDNVKSGRVLISLKLKTLFADWWINHINHTDYQSFQYKTN